MAQFPPAPFDVAFKQIAIYDAWYSNDLDSIPEASGAPATHMHRGQPHTGGLVGAVSSGVFGTPVGENRSAMSIPVAGDLAQLSADLLFAEAPSIVLPESQGKDAQSEMIAAQARLELIMSSDESHAELLRSGEYSAAHGGTYLACVWDVDVADHVWFRAYRADCAIPEFRYGKLSGVTLWTEYARKDDVYRLKEQHKPGSVTFSLWKGEAGEDGSQVRLDTIPETAHYLSLVDVPEADRLGLPEADTLDVLVRTGVPWLAVEFYPNMLPNPVWDKKGVLANLGRSDFYALEPLFARINAIWSSLMRDFDNGAGRLTVPASYLMSKGPGQGAAFDMGRQVYSPVNGLVDDGKGGQITISQFDIRVEEHLQAIEQLKREIAMSAGYSVSHFGIHESGVKTATEIADDRSDSERTRDKKALYVKPALARLARTALAIDGLVFPGKGGMIVPSLPDIEFAEVSQIDPEKRNRTVLLADQARAMSTRARVAAAQPLLTEEQIDDEVTAILRENGMTAAPDPTTFTGDDPEVE